MNNLKLEKDRKGEDNIIEDVKNLFRLKTEIFNQKHKKYF